MSRISGHDSRRRRRGFTLVEVMVSTSLLAIVLTGTLSAYLFLGRNLTRMVNIQQQETQSRLALRYFTQDVSAAIALASSMSSSYIELTKPSASATNTTVKYIYSSGSGTLVRKEQTEPAAERSQTLVTGLTSFSITYYNEAGTAISSSPQSVKSVEMVFSSATGTSTSGTLARYTSVSPRVLLRNKQALQ